MLLLLFAIIARSNRTLLIVFYVRPSFQERRTRGYRTLLLMFEVGYLPRPYMCVVSMSIIVHSHRWTGHANNCCHSLRIAIYLTIFTLRRAKFSYALIPSQVHSVSSAGRTFVIRPFTSVHISVNVRPHFPSMDQHKQMLLLRCVGSHDFRANSRVI
jgi:hypothetical protein